MNESWSQGEAHCRALHSAGTLGLVRSVAELHWVRASVLLQGVPHWVGLHMVMQGAHSAEQCSSLWSLSYIMQITAFYTQMAVASTRAALTCPPALLEE